jgi:Kef-type K+ transport system membrane component KefB
LFTIGLHFNIKEIANVKYLPIALFGVVLPWVAGFFLSKAFGFDSSASIFIGTALTATSIAITANVLKELGKLETAAAKAVIGAAVIDDILSLLALSMSESIVSGELTTIFVLITLAKAIAFIVIGILVGKFVITRLLVRLDCTPFCGKYPESIFILAIMIAFLFSMLAELVGLSAIVGSFLAGVAIGNVTLTHGAAFREGAEHLQIIFASIFFISLGVLLDVRILTLDLLWFVLALTAVALLTKFIGCGLPAWLWKTSVKDSMIIGTGMVPRGEVAMIIALIGLNQNLISQNTYAALILMSLLTTIIPPLIMRNLLYREKTKNTEAE